MSLRKLKDFIKKVTRVLFIPQNLAAVAGSSHQNAANQPGINESGSLMASNPGMANMDKKELSQLIQKEAVAKIIPLCIDYILEYEVAEVQQLADLLQLNDTVVRQALNKLQSFGILSEEEMQREAFLRKYAEKLGIPENQQAEQLPTNAQARNLNFGGAGCRKLVSVYYFNIDILYILNARIFTLEQQLNQRLEQRKNNRGNQYICSNYKIGRCHNKEEVFETTYATGTTRCTECKAELVENQLGVLNIEVNKGCRQIIVDLKKDLEVLKKYRIPPHIFGPAAQQAQKSFQDDKFEQFDFECINYRVDIANKNEPLNIGIYQKEKPIEILKKNPQQQILGSRRDAPSTMNQLQDEFYVKTFNSRKIDKTISKLPKEIYEFYANKVKEQFRNKFQEEGPKVQEAIDAKKRLDQERRMKHEERMKEFRQ